MVEPDSHDGGHHIDCDEGPEDELLPQPPAFAFAETTTTGCGCAAAGFGPGDEARQADVDARGDQHGRGDDEEVLHDEVADAVRVPARGEGAEDVAHHLEQARDGQGGEGPESVSVGVLATGRAC